MKVIIVDDESIICSTLEFILKKDGHEPVSFSSASAALQSIRDTKYDLAFIDLSMPEMNGTDLIASVVREKNHPRIVAMSGVDWKDTLLQGALSAGAHTILKKPFSVDEVRTILFA